MQAGRKWAAVSGGRTYRLLPASSLSLRGRAPVHACMLRAHPWQLTTVAGAYATANSTYHGREQHELLARAARHLHCED